VRLADTARSRKILGDIDGSLRPAVARALEQFVRDPTAPSLNFERLVGFPDSYSIRASRALRIVLRQIETELFEVSRGR
jgi:hypothetical protein